LSPPRKEIIMSNFSFKGKAGTCTISAAAKPILLKRFKDFRGVDCIISVADTIEETILVGCEKADIKKLVVGEGMQPVYIPPPYTANTQMNLDREMAANVIEVLEAFLEVTKQPLTFDDADLETTVIACQPEPKKVPPTSKVVNHQPAPPTKPQPIPALQKAKAIKDTQQIIDRLKINRLQKAFVYLLGKVSGFYTGNWTTSEAITSAVIKFGLSKREARRLRKMYGISRSSGTAER
jgi:hypothetical protein